MKNEVLATAFNGPGRFFLFASLDDAVEHAESTGGTIVPVTKMHFRYRRWIAGRAMIVRYVVLR